MREIEFRAKGLRKNKWFCGDLLTRTQDGACLIVDYYNKDGVKYIEVNKNTIGQYTGLKDKNGQKIFEGDFIKARHNDELYKVHWEWFRFIIEDNYGNMILPVQGAIDHFECEVIGNLYDNPELLKGE